MTDPDSTVGIVVSRADPASVHIGEHLLELAEWETVEDDARPDATGGGAVHRTDGFSLREFDTLHLDIDRAADVFGDPRMVVFASKHAGDTGRFLSAHHTGNVGPAEAGGRTGAFAPACPNAHSRVLDALTEHAPTEYDVGMECTHHGPTDVGCPTMFVELGSSETEWKDPAGARAVARAILALRGVSPARDRQVVGFGGGHYAPRFERVVRTTDWAVGHVGADWALDAMGDPHDHRDVLRRAFERSGATRALVEGDRPELAGVVEGLGYRVVSETWLRETSTVPLDFVADAETALASVDEGLRFGAPARTDAVEEFTTERLPTELVAEAEGIDPDAAREAVAQHALAFGTRQSGTRLASGVLLGRPTDRKRIVEGLVRVLRAKYDEIERREGEIVAHETAFDPDEARAAGVPEGPAFGRLADGRTVEVDGRTVRPETVHTRRKATFALGSACDTRRTKGER